MAPKKGRAWGLKEWALALSLFVTASAALSIVVRWYTGAQHVVDHHIVQTAVDSLEVFRRMHP